MPRATGRPRRRYEVSLQPMEGYLVIRVDDRDDPEFWQSIEINEAELLAMVWQIHEKTEKARAEGRASPNDTRPL